MIHDIAGNIISLIALGIIVYAIWIMCATIRRKLVQHRTLISIGVVLFILLYLAS